MLKKEFLRKCKQMHAKRADGIWLNAMSLVVIVCAVIVLNTRDVKSPKRVYESSLVHELRRAEPAVAQ